MGYELRDVPIELLIPTPDNPRVIREDDPALAELAQSLNELGMIEPVIARPHPTEADHFDLRAGERRLRAAQRLNWPTVPTLVYAEMNDETAMTVTVTENMRRQNLTAWEEGAGVASMLAAFGEDIEAVAAELGQSPAWVVRRAKLRDLTEEWRKALAKGDLPWMGLGHFELIARYPADVQADIRKHGPHYTMSVKEFRAHLEREYEQLLRSAPWALDDAEMVTEGACETCLHRSARQGLLFEDDNETAEKRDRCLRPECWERKHKAWIETAWARYHEEYGEKLLAVVTGYTKTSQLDFDGVPRPLAAWEWTAAKNASRGAKPALIVDGAGAGTLTWVKPSAAARSGLSSKGKTKTLAERRAVLERKRWAATLKQLEGLVRRCVQPEDSVLLPLAAVFGTNHRNDTAGEFYRAIPGKGGWACEMVDPWPLLAPMAADLDDARANLWRSVRAVMVKRIHWTGGVTQVPEAMIADAWKLAALCRLDLDAMRVEAAEANPEPRSWAKLEAEEKAAAAAKAKRKTTERTEAAEGGS